MTDLPAMTGSSQPELDMQATPISAAMDSEGKSDPCALLKDLIDDQSLELPLLPETSSKLIALCNSEDCPPHELAECIRCDQSIATNVLRIANSAMYSSGAPIVSLQQSVARLGMKRIREIVLIVSCQGRVFDVRDFELEVRNSFRRSLGAAAFAQEIARIRRLNVEDAFLCGLLHDIGRPVLLQAVVDEQQRRGDQFKRDEVLAAVEMFRVSVGSQLIEQWNLPSRIAAATGRQSLPDATEGCQESKILNLSIYMAESLLDSGDLDLHETLKHPLVSRLNIYPDQLDSILGKRDAIADWINSTQ